MSSTHRKINQNLIFDASSSIGSSSAVDTLPQPPQQVLQGHALAAATMLKELNDKKSNRDHFKSQIEELSKLLQDNKNPMWGFKKSRNGSGFAFLSKQDSKEIEDSLEHFLQGGHRYIFLITGDFNHGGQDIYMVFFAVTPSDKQFLDKLQENGRDGWTPTDHERHNKALQDVLVANANKNFEESFLYVKIKCSQGKAGPARVAVRKQIDDEYIQHVIRFPLGSKKDLSEACRILGMSENDIESMGLFGIQAVHEYMRQRYSDLRHLADSEAYEWLHKHGWRPGDYGTFKIMKDNMTEKGLFSVVFATGKSIKLVSFRAVDPQDLAEYVKMIMGPDQDPNDIISPGKLYFLQGGADWSLADKTKNWRLISFVKEDELSPTNRQRWELAKMFPELDSYEIDNVWSSFEYPEIRVSLPPQYYEEVRVNMEKTIASVSDLKLSSLSQHVILDRIHDGLTNVTSETFMSFVHQVMNEDLICIIGQCKFTHPVITPSGHTFEKDDIIRWVNQKRTNPVTNLTLQARQLETDNITKALMDLFKNLL